MFKLSAAPLEGINCEPVCDFLTPTEFKRFIKKLDLPKFRIGRVTITADNVRRAQLREYMELVYTSWQKWKKQMTKEK